jgi:uncharacterized protein YlxP (DUF503 family)
VTAHVLAITIDLHLADSHSLKDKRAVVKTLLDGSRRRFGVAAAETGHLDLHQRAELSMVAVSSTATHTTEVIDEVERFVWSFPEVEVLDSERSWLELP